MWATDVLTLDCATPAETSSSTSLDASGIATFLNSAAGLSSAENKITCSAKTGDVYSGKGSGGGEIPQECLKVGKASGAGGFTFTIPNTYDQIGSVDITCYGWKTSSSISINSGTAQTFTTAQVETKKTFELASATRTISIAVTSSAVCITEIVLKSAVTGEATTVTIDASGITNTDIASGTAAGSFSAVVKDASSNTIGAASVTWTSSKPSVATINSTGEVTLVKKGTTTITASYAGVDGTYQPSSNTYVLNVTNSAANDGTSTHPFTVSEARDALNAGETDAGTDYYVKGYIAKIGTFDNGALTYWISDDGSMTDNLQCYKGKNVDGDAFAAATDIEVGDIAIVKGKLKIYQTTTYELDENNEVVSITQRTKVNIATFTATTNPLILGVTETTVTSVTNDQAGWTPASYTYESDDTDVATVDDNGVITAVAKGTANITVTPVVSATDPIYKVGESKSIEIAVSNPSHNATFSVNGTTNIISVEEGDAIAFPADPADIGGKKFVGWTEATIDGTTDVAPTFVESATMSTGDVTYYAVFAIKTEDTKVISQNLTITNSDFKSKLSGSYSTVTIKKTIGETDYNIEVNACKQSDWCQMRDNATLSYIYVPTLPGNITNISTTECTNASGDEYSGTIHIKNKKTRGNSDTDDITKATLSNAESFSIDLTGDDKSFYLLTSAGLRIWDLTITYSAEGTVTTYSDYCTSIPSSVPVTITSTSGLTTLYTGYALDVSSLSSELKAYTATVSENTVTLTEVSDIPAKTGVVLKGTVKTHNVPVAASSSTERGDLIGNTSAATAYNAFSGYDLYMLALNDQNKAQFTKVASGSIAAGKAFLKLSSGAGARELNVVFADDDVTGISTMHNSQCIMNNEFYNLAGQRVAQPTKGLYIVNGKKVVIK